MNKIRTVAAIHTTHDDYIEYRFMRQDISRYYNARRISPYSRNRINRLLREHGTPFIGLDEISIDWFVRE